MDIVQSDLEKVLQNDIEKDNPLDYLNIYRSLADTINVLIGLKNEGLNHLDIKPCNILLNYKGTGKYANEI